jgi:hypothetical protein
MSTHIGILEGHKDGNAEVLELYLNRFCGSMGEKEEEDRRRVQLTMVGKQIRGCSRSMALDREQVEELMVLLSRALDDKHTD